MGKFSFTRKERLSKEKWIKELFAKGSALNIYPFRVLHLKHPDPGSDTHQVLITISIRNFKRASDRNLLKRRVREAYRLNKHLLFANSNLLIAYIYTSKQVEPYDAIETSLIRILTAISAKRAAKIQKENPPA